VASRAAGRNFSAPWSSSAVEYIQKSGKNFLSKIEFKAAKGE